MKVLDLTIVIITNRNDKKFQDALKSAQFAGEVLVIKNNEKILDFSKARNDALKQVKTTWVLFLDSDETLPEKSHREIKKIIDANLYDSIRIKRVDYFLGKPLNHGEPGNTRLVRLFKTQKGSFVRKVHEVVKYYGVAGEATFNISHYSHESIKDFLIKIAEYARLDSQNRQQSHLTNTIQMCVYPGAKFVLNYILKLGFLDGYRGLMYAVVMSLHSFFVRVYYYEKN